MLQTATIDTLAAEVIAARDAECSAFERAIDSRREYYRTVGLPGIVVAGQWITDPHEIDDMVRQATEVFRNPGRAKEIRDQFNAAIRTHSDAWAASGGAEIEAVRESAEIRKDLALRELAEMPVHSLTEMAAKLRAVISIYEEDPDEDGAPVSVPGKIIATIIDSISQTKPTA